MIRNYTFLLNHNEIHIPKSLKFLNKLSENVCNHLLFENKYNVQSDVHLKHLSSFLSFLNSDEEYPTINVDNFCDYRLLCEELSTLKDYYTKPKFEEIYKISILKNIKEPNYNFNKSELENYISQNLDLFLKNHFNDMYSIPFTSLYNIFYNSNRQLTQYSLAYQFLTKSLTKSTENDCDELQQHLFVLLGSIDAKYLTASEIIDSIINHEQRHGFLPLLDFSFIEVLNEIFTKLSIKTDCNIKKTVEELKQKLREISQIIIENQQLKKTIDEDQENQSKLVGKIDNLQKENQEKDKNINELQDKNDNLQKENQEKENKINELQDKNDNLQKENQEKGKNINQFQGTIDKLQIVNKEKDKKINQLQRKINFLQKENKKKDKIIDQLLGKIDNLQKESPDKDLKIKSEKEENGDLNEHNKDKEEVDTSLFEKSDNKVTDDLSEESVNNEKQIQKKSFYNKWNMKKTNKKLVRKKKPEEEVQNSSLENISFDYNPFDADIEQTKTDDDVVKMNSNSSDNISTLSNLEFMDENLFENSLFGAEFEIENIEDISFPSIKSDSITIIFFLRSYLYTKDMQVRKFYIENKSDSQSNIGNLLKLIKKDYSTINPKRILKYYIYKDNHNDFKIKFLNENDLIYKIPKYLLIQIVPHRSYPFRFCVFIDIFNINIDNFDPNIDGIPFAIVYNQNINTDKFILDYLFHSVEGYKKILESDLFQPVFYKFSENSFSKVDDNSQIFQNIDEPCFFSLSSRQANEIVCDLFKSHITNKCIFRPK